MSGYQVVELTCAGCGHVGKAVLPLVHQMMRCGICLTTMPAPPDFYNPNVPVVEMLKRDAAQRALYESQPGEHHPWEQVVSR